MIVIAIVILIVIVVEIVKQTPILRKRWNMNVQSLIPLTVCSCESPAVVDFLELILAGVASSWMPISLKRVAACNAART